MNLPWILAGLLTLAVLLAWTRLLLWRRRAPQATRWRAWRFALLLSLQPLCAALLYFTLLPPALPTQAGSLIVATARATSTRADITTAGDRLIALPEAPTLPGAARVPDLATALRTYPGVTRLRILGAGLEPRDREAARGVALSFDPAPLPRGVVRLDTPPAIAAGSAFAVAGRVEGVNGGTVELRDPADQRVDRSLLLASGEFVLRGTSRVSGSAMFTLHVRDSQGKRVEAIAVPLIVASDPAPRVWLLAGAPGPEVKYLRRWAADAGLPLHTQLSVGGGLQLGDAPLPMNAATLQRFDLLVLDDRRWAALRAGERAALGEALRGGLGVLLRITGPLPDATRRQLRALGMTLTGGADTATLRLPVDALDDEAQRARRGPGTRDAPSAVTGASNGNPELTRRAVRITATDAVPLLRDATGAVIASWRAEGRGRFAVWPLTDSFALTLSGQADRHAELWSETFATVARARSNAAPRIDPQAREQQRMALCGLAGKPRVLAPDGRVAALLPDPATGDSACAAYWPRRSGWHLLQQTDADAGERAWPFFVYAADAAPGLRAAERRDATLRLLGASHERTTNPGRHDAVGRRGPSWPWFLAWLISAAALWWLERARFGRASAAA